MHWNLFMSILLNQSRELIAFDIYFIQKVNIHNITTLDFIRNKDDFEEWEDKGYVVEDKITDEDDSSKIIHKITTYWKLPSWKDQNELMSRSFTSKTINNSVVSDFDVIKYRDLKLKQLLKKWTLKDETDNIIELSNSVIDSLHPAMANELIASFEKASGEINSFE